MDEAHQILVNGLEQAGVVMPSGVLTIQDVGSGCLVSICSQALHLINDSYSFPTFMPPSMAERFRLCTDLATVIKQLGYRGDMSFHQFLYPSEENTYKLLRFMLEKLSKSPLGSTSRGHRRGRGGGAAAGGRLIGKGEHTRIATIVRDSLHKCVEQTEQVSTHADVVPFRTRPLRLANAMSKKTPALITLQAKPKAWLCSSVLELNAKNALQAGNPTRCDDHVEETDARKVISHGFLEAESSSTARFDMPYAEGYLFRSAKYSEDRDYEKSLEEFHTNKEESHKNELGPNDEEEKDSIGSKDHENEKYIRDLEERLTSLKRQASQMEGELSEVRNQELLLKEKVYAKQLETDKLEEENLLVKKAIDMAMDSKQPREFYSEQLNKQIAALKLEWDTARLPLEEKKASLKNLIHSQKSKVQDKMEELKSVQKKTERINAKIHEREKQETVLAKELENAPKVATRNSYIRRITELAKNSKKQDADIDRIIHDTQQFQRESNAAQDRLRRTYALVDEIVFRDAKKDPACRQAYRLLTSIHETFNEACEKVFSIDKVQREIAEYETKLEVMQRSHLDVSKVQDDLDTIWKENELLEKQLQRKLNEK